MVKPVLSAKLSIVSIRSHCLEDAVSYPSMRCRLDLIS